MAKILGPFAIFVLFAFFVFHLAFSAFLFVAKSL